MILKKALIAAISFLSMTICSNANISKSLTPYDQVLYKRSSIITYTCLTASGGAPYDFTFDVGISEPNTVDYRVVVGIWIYQQGFYNCGRPMKCYGWYWAYRYYSTIIPAGQTYHTTDHLQWVYNQSETPDLNNYYVSFYGPN